MTKRAILSTAAAAVLALPLCGADTDEQIEALQQKMQSLQKELNALKKSAGYEDEEEKSDESEITERLDDIDEQLSELNRNTNGNHLKLGVDFRTSVDNLQYKMADGSKQSNDAFLTNRLWINMDWLATENISFTGQLAYNKAFGNRSGFGGGIAGFENFDWIVNENPYDDNLRVRSAYFFYRNDTFLGTDVPWTFSIGRRPSTNGHLINYRDNDPAASPMGHTINVEFDGLSSRFGLENVTGVDGMYVKFCAGRGSSNADAKFFTVNPANYVVSSAAPYAVNANDIPNIDLAGLIFVPYDNGQYSVGTQYYYAGHLIDAKIANTPAGPVYTGMEDVGNMHSFTANFTANGIGDGWSEFLDDSLVFVSLAMSLTEPKKGGQGMLGSTESKMGRSYWIGTQFPSLISESGRWGIEYNHGTKYWRSVTYAEDTMIGSKVAARGNAYEAYFTEYLIEDVLSMQLRYTYIDYNFAGSNGFFGSTTGTPTDIDTLKNSPYGGVTVDTAQDIRLYLRYRY